MSSPSHSIRQNSERSDGKYVRSQDHPWTQRPGTSRSRTNTERRFHRTLVGGGSPYPFNSGDWSCTESKARTEQAPSHLWDVVIEVLLSCDNHTPPTEKNSANEGRAKGAVGDCLRISNVSVRKEGNQNVDHLSNLDHVPTNANTSQSKAQLYFFEDSEAVDQDDHHRTKSNDETRVQNPQSLVGLVV